MERLTMRDDKGVAFWIDHRCAGGGYRLIEDKKDQKHLDRLAAYEDTGLAPEEVRELMASPPNDPLTLEQLREMGGEPVWVECLGSKEYSAWTIVDFCLDGIHTKYFYADFNYYGDEWLAYRRRPEEGKA